METKAVNFAGYVPQKVKGIAERDRPVGTGHCNAENCGHKSHLKMTVPAK